MRAAMGATRTRIVRQLLIESVMLSLFGAALGIFLAQWILSVILSHMPPDIARYIAGWKTIRLDFGAFLFTFGVALASGLLSGIAPSLMSSRTNISETLKESGRGASSGRARHRLRSILVVAEVSLSLVLLVGAGLLVKGFNALLTVNQQYRPESLLTLNLDLPRIAISAEVCACHVSRSASAKSFHHSTSAICGAGHDRPVWQWRRHGRGSLLDRRSTCRAARRIAYRHHGDGFAQLFCGDEYRLERWPDIHRL